MPRKKDKACHMAFKVHRKRGHCTCGNPAIKSEISIDEPLNIDWDGNELLLSDILGSDSDEVGRGVEIEDEKNLLMNRLIN